jgi:Flp pilus assembly protein TadG
MANPTRFGSARGVAAIEFALALPVLLLLLAGVADLGFAVYAKMQVQDAAEAGALYAAQNGWNPAGIGAAVVQATGAANILASPAPSQFCGCPTGGHIVATTCGANCPDGTAAGSYIQVNASVPRPSILTSFGFSLPATLTGQAVVRVQ